MMVINSRYTADTTGTATISRGGMGPDMHAEKDISLGSFCADPTTPPWDNI